ncbi:transposase [Bradyrhizobium sp. USDA 4341]
MEKRPARRNRGKLPEHLPRIDVVIDIESHSCPCCGEQLHKIGETAKEAFDVIPMQYRIKRIVRPRYGCRGCRQYVVQAPATQAIDGGMVTEALLAHVAVTKYGYQLPLYRQEQMFAAQGVTLDRQTLASWMGRLASWLKPLHALLHHAVMSYPRLFADETPLPVLDPGRGRTKVCQFWAIATDDRPWGGPAPPAVIYVFAEDRKAIRAKRLFGEYRGILQVDVCGRPSECKQNITSEQACGRVLTCVRPRNATSTRRGPLWNAWIGSNSATRARWHSSTC